MKILFIANLGEDYLKDSIYHGLKSVYGTDVVSTSDLDYMYSDYPNKSSLYGKGFTLYCNLDPNLKTPIDKLLMETLIKIHHFDYIFYGSIWRCHDYYDLVKENYKNDEIILFDGEDGPNLHPLFEFHPYFKRELENKITEKLYPIGFSIPKEKFVKNYTEISKVKDYGHIIPGQKETYIFDKEEDYYKDYQQSYFGVTTKKAGWDCLRHYEILANACLPYFINLEDCPFYTLFNFPKDIIEESNKLAYGFDSKIYNELLSKAFIYAKNYLTTEATIKYVFEKLRKEDECILDLNKNPMLTPEIEDEYNRLCSPNEGQSVDIVEHLPTLFKYAYHCDRVTEMGVRSVVSTWAFLKAYPQKLTSYDIEYHPNIEKALRVAKQANIQFDYILKDVLKTEIEETDFLFLDTWHVYEQVKAELELHHAKVKQYIGFHDTTSYEWNGEGVGKKGIWPAIQEFLDSHPKWKIAERFTNNNGLTILERVS